jgi:hypothetical protein
MAKKKAALKTTEVPVVKFDAALVTDVRHLILNARQQVARAVDSGLVVLSWSIGQRIRKDILQEKRAEYGTRIVSALGRQLSMEFGEGYGEKICVT